ncbi:MAG: hypothetical protein HQL57_05360 [Magnetococcales bacterium]|nr:hypothetical protein [Magnetococcales bacterium]
MAGSATIPAALAGGNEREVPLTSLAAAPVTDGVASEWGSEGWVEVPVHPAKEKDDLNTTGAIVVRLKGGVHGGRLYLVADWPDPQADTTDRPWRWKGGKYRRGTERDDMFAVRFDMAGDYYECMFTKTDYQVDLWQWSAGRSDPASVAEDYIHIVSLSLQEDAAEYEMPEGGTVYIKKIRDAGDPVYRNTTPDEGKNQGKELPGTELTGKASGSLVDVAAKGTWKGGRWTLELSRQLDTGHADDVVFKAGAAIKGAVAVFNANFAEHKSVSDTLTFRLPSAK